MAHRITRAYQDRCDTGAWLVIPWSIIGIGGIVAMLGIAAALALVAAGGPLFGFTWTW